MRSILRRQRPTRDFRSVATWETDAVEEDVRIALEGLRDVGLMQVLAVDLSRSPDLAVVRVVVPGLEGPADSPKYVPGPRARSLAENPCRSEDGRRGDDLVPPQPRAPQVRGEGPPRAERPGQYVEERRGGGRGPRERSEEARERPRTARRSRRGVLGRAPKART